VEEAATILGIENYLDRKPKTLSGGQRQRVAVGRAIVRKPKVFLFDEPLSNLDAKMRVQMRAEITKLHQHLKATMIYVTHDQVEAMTMGDRVVVMKEGIIQQTDAPLKLYNEPANLFVAGFLGSPGMNIVRGNLSRSAEKVFFKESGGGIEWEFPGNLATELPEGGEILIGIRPEDFRPAADEAPGANRFPALVDLVETTGAETNLYLHTGAHNLVCRIQSPPGDRAASQCILFEIDLKKVHFFDPQNTKRIV
jgi:multiple sugar transport system ATP-binding protein